MKAYAKLGSIIGVLAFATALLGLVALQAEAGPEDKCNDCSGISAVQLGF